MKIRNKLIVIYGKQTLCFEMEVLRLTQEGSDSKFIIYFKYENDNGNYRIRIKTPKPNKFCSKHSTSVTNAMFVYKL